MLMRREEDQPVLVSSQDANLGDRPRAFFGCSVPDLHCPVGCDGHRARLQGLEYVFFGLHEVSFESTGTVPARSLEPK
jgi:hypothetical protein